VSYSGKISPSVFLKHTLSSTTPVLWLYVNEIVKFNHQFCCN
jgi:hypothetical protein